MSEYSVQRLRGGYALVYHIDGKRVRRRLPRANATYFRCSAAHDARASGGMFSNCSEGRFIPNLQPLSARHPTREPGRGGVSAVHIVPVNDLRDHEAKSACWCRPTEVDGIWVHHSMDRREHTKEKGKVQ